MMKPKTPTTRKKIWIFACLCVVCYVFIFLPLFHARSMTVFTDTAKPRQKLRAMSFSDKASALFFGVPFGKPKTKKPKPPHYQETALLGHNNYKLSAWTFGLDKPKQVLLLHGYVGEKSDLLKIAAAYEKMNYGVTLLDFFGSGGSGGNFTTIGFYEAHDVRAAVDMIRGANKKAYLEVYAVSLGAAAFLKSNHNGRLDVNSVVLEMPFASMQGTVCNRLKLLKAPCFPAALALTWWGGVIHGFDALNYKPSLLAKKLRIPTLVLAARNDARAPVKDSEEIINNATGPKKLVVFEDAQHQSLLAKDPHKWRQSIQTFHQQPK